MDQDPGPEAEPWARLHSTSGPWYDEEIAQKIYFRPSHTGLDSDPWKLGSIERAAPVERPPLGKELPPLQRSKRCPGQSAVPDVVSKAYDQSTLDKKPKIYILAFPGMGDAVNAGWVKQEMETPENFEWGTYEWPGHGERKDETPRTTDIAELGADAFETFREALSVGHYILVGHSIGVLLMTYVAIRAERELGTRPLVCFALDRVAPHQRVYSPYSHWIARNDPIAWMQVRYPGLAHAFANSLATEDTMDMITKDESIQTDTILPEFYGYSFPCKVYVFIALLAVRKNMLAAMPEGYREELRRHFCNGKGYNSDPEEFEEWRKWGSDIDIRKVEVDHKDLVFHNRFLTVLYREVTQHLKKAEAALKKGGKAGKASSGAKKV